MSNNPSFAKFRRANYELFRLFRIDEQNKITFVVPKEQPIKSFFDMYNNSKELLEIKHNVETEYYMLIEDIELDCVTFSDFLEVRKLKNEDWEAIARIQSYKKPVNLRDYSCKTNRILMNLLRFSMLNENMRHNYSIQTFGQH